MSLHKSLSLFSLVFTLSLQFGIAQQSKEKSTIKGNGFTFECGARTTMNIFPPAQFECYDNGNFIVSTHEPIPYSDEVKTYVSRINTTLVCELEKQIKTEKEDKKATYNHLMYLINIGKDLCAIEKEKLASSKKINYYLQVLNKQTLVLENTKKLIYTLDYNIDSERDLDVVNFISDDENNYLVIYDQHYVNKKENAKVTISVLNNTLEKLWSKTVILPVVGEEKGVHSFGYYIDQNTNLFLLSKVYNNVGEDVVKGVLNYDYHLYAIGKDIKDFIDFPFRLKDKAVTQIKINSKKTGELVVAGIYADIHAKENEISLPRGIFYSVLDLQNNTVKSQSYKEFTTEVYTSGLKDWKAEREIKRIEKGNNDGLRFKIIAFLNREDGGSTLIAEYAYNNIVVANISESGIVNWISVIPKKHAGILHASSFCYFKHKDDGLHFFFNDHWENYGERASKEGVVKALEMNKDGIFVSVEVKPDGKVGKKTPVFKLDHRDQNTIYYPDDSYKSTKNNEIILYGLGIERFAKLHFEN